VGAPRRATTWRASASDADATASPRHPSPRGKENRVIPDPDDSRKQEVVVNGKCIGFVRPIIGPYTKAWEAVYYENGGRENRVSVHEGLDDRIASNAKDSLVGVHIVRTEKYNVIEPETVMPTDEELEAADRAFGTEPAFESESEDVEFDAAMAMEVFD
jgi:hypothetical protein